MSRVKKVVSYLLILALFEIFIYQNPFCCIDVYSQGTELKYIKQLGMKGIESGQFTFPHSLAVDNLVTFVGDTGNKGYKNFTNAYFTSWGSEGSNDGQFWV
jgi:hypothetical protein